MFKVIGKAYYKVKYEGQEYPKIRYTLQLDQEDIAKKYNNVQGPLCDTIMVKHDSANDKPKIGDHVVVSYGVYKGQQKVNGIFVIT